jgi:transcriptional regulator with GAF, ATPase, and Fis domain
MLLQKIFRDLPIELQPKILRVIEERKVRRIGENEERGVDVRFIFATNRDLWEEAKLRRFRDDLLHRIETFVLRIPPLRERKREEIEEIVKGLWKRLIEADISKLDEKGLEKRELNDEEMEILLEYHFPGNIRGLENILKRYKLKGSGHSRLKILKEEVEEERRRWGRDSGEEISGKSLKEILLKFERETIQKALDENGWNISRTAERLGIPRSVLQYKIKKHKLTKES